MAYNPDKFPHLSFAGEEERLDNDSLHAAQPALIHVLLVEDSLSDKRLMQLALQDAGDAEFEVNACETLQDAIREIDRDHPDVILLDLHLPDSSGWSTFSDIRKKAPQIPVVISTGLQDDELALEAIQEGAQDYFNKELATYSGVLPRILRYAIERERSRLQLKNAFLNLEDALKNLRKTQISLVEAEKLKTVGRLAAGVAHEVKNPLAIIRMGMDFLKRKLPEEDNVCKTIVADLYDALKRADVIIGELMQFGAPKEIKPEHCQLETLMQEALRLTVYDLQKKSITLVQELDDTIPVMADAQSITQVLVNLILNAVQAMDNGGQISIRVHHNPDPRTGRMTSPDWVEAEIRDNGPGIPSDVLDRIFEPFFTTKSGKGGTGLGLSVCHTIMELHHGKIKLANHPDGGSIARISLRPISSQKGRMLSNIYSNIERSTNG